jgi:hypothetical protein
MSDAQLMFYDQAMKVFGNEDEHQFVHDPSSTSRANFTD